MPEIRGATRILIDHFFRRFFDSDTAQLEGETLTTVVRATAIVAAPGLITAFFLINQYPHRPQWGAIQDQYFFVLYSFVVMSIAAIFEWEMLFPDRQDFLILTPLPVKPLKMLTAKVAALTAFLTVFLASANIFATLVFPAVSKGAFFRQVYAHGCAVILAGLFAALFFLALGGVLLCLLGAPRFRVVSPVVQTLSVTVIVLQLLWYMRYSDRIQSWLAEPSGIAHWLPPVWFLAIYQHLLHGRAAPPFAREMMPYAVYGTIAAAGVVLLTYPLAWARMRKASIEGALRKRRKPAQWPVRLLNRIIRRPAERATFHFIGRTIARNNRYQLYLAMYCGAGLALTIAFALDFQTRGQHVQAALSQEGLHAVMPLLLFWVIAGLRAAFAFPTDLAAGWVFRVSSAGTGECATAGRRWALFCAGIVMSCVLAALRLAGWDLRHILVQAVWGVCLCILLTDGFFAFHKGIPFNQPRMPGTKSLPLMLTLYVGVLPIALLGIIRMEMHHEEHLADLVLLGFGAAALHIGLGRLQTGPDEVEEEMEGYEGEFQILGLS